MQLFSFVMFVCILHLFMRNHLRWDTLLHIKMVLGRKTFSLHNAGGHN